ncbi:MAG TPA: hypothetical protein VIN57_06955 [Magnetovibrio sp.]
MFGFSLTKLIFTAVVVYAVWQAFKYFTRLSEQREKRRGTADDAARSSSKSASAEVEDMVQCSVCDAYTARGSKSCGKAGCPFRG